MLPGSQRLSGCPPTRGFRYGPLDARISGASGERRGCFSAFTVQGLRGEGRQRPPMLQLLRGVL